MAADLTKVGPTLIDMDSLTQYLWHVGVNIPENYEGEYDPNEDPGFLLKSEKATDTKKVGNQPAESIAVAYMDPDKEVVLDRETVKNAMELGGRSFEDYITIDNEADLNTRIDDVNTNYSKEITDIRDELYQLRAELAKTGTVQAYKPYSGYYDIFRSNAPLHDYAQTALIAEDSPTRLAFMIADSDFDSFHEGDYLRLINDENEDCVVQIDRLGADRETVTLTSPAAFELKEGTRIYKSKGNNINESFLFGEANVVSPDMTQKMVTSVNDDTNLELYPMPSAPNASQAAGYAFTFRIPEAMQGNYLSKMELMGKQYGSPGNMICYLIDERDIGKWKNSTQAKADGLIVAQSKPVAAEKANDITLPAHAIEFTFYDEKTGEYPFIPKSDTISHRIRYVAIIEILYATRGATLENSDNYNLYFVKGTSGDDLETNNIIYVYNALESDTSNDMSAFTPPEFVADMYYSLTMVKADTRKFTPYEDGIYSAKFSLAEPVKAGQARVTMRIAREGQFHILSDDIAAAAADSPVIHVEGDTYTTTSGTYTDTNCFTYSAGRYVIIGTTPRLVTAVNGTRLTLDGGFDAHGDDPVYPVNYNVYLLAKDTAWNQERRTVETRSQKKFELKLSHVMPDQFHDNETISDRLIFQADLIDKDLQEMADYNEFELQIYWSHSARDQNERNVGRIYDLAVSFSRAHFVDTNAEG